MDICTVLLFLMSAGRGEILVFKGTEDGVNTVACHLKLTHFSSLFFKFTIVVTYITCRIRFYNVISGESSSPLIAFSVGRKPCTRDLYFMYLLSTLFPGCTEPGSDS